MREDHSSKPAAGVFAALSKLLWGASTDAPLSHAPLSASEHAEPADYTDSDTIDAETLAEVHDQLARGRKIEAIKAYRHAASCDLKTAKEAVERLADNRRAA